MASAVAACLPVCVVLSFCVASPTPLPAVSFFQRGPHHCTYGAAQATGHTLQKKLENRRPQALPCPPTPPHAKRALCTGSPEKAAELSAARSALARFPPATLSTSPVLARFAAKTGRLAPVSTCAWASLQRTWRSAISNSLRWTWRITALRRLDAAWSLCPFCCAILPPRRHLASR